MKVTAFNWFRFWLCAFALAMAFFVARTCKAATWEAREASTDDHIQLDATETFRNETLFELTYGGSAGYYRIGWRFINVQIGPGATVSAATIDLRAVGTCAGTINFKIMAQSGTASPPNFSGDATPSVFNARTRTTAKIDWDFSVPGDCDASVTTVDITSVIQEVINYAGWVCGSAIVIILENDGTTAGNTWVGSTYDSAPENAPYLHITYTGGSSCTSSATFQPRRIQILKKMSSLDERFPVFGQWEASCAQ